MREKIKYELSLLFPTGKYHILKLKKNNPELEINIKLETSYIINPKNFNENIYHIIYDLYEIPKCKICNNNECTFINFNKGYSNYCSIKCSKKDPIIIEKIRNSNLKTYSKNLHEIKTKQKQTNIERYGVEDPNKTEKIKNKIKESNLKKYGVEHNSHCKEIINKRKKTNLKRYGANSYLQTEEFKEQVKKTNLKKYGIEYNIQRKEIKDKIKLTMLKKYGVDNIFKSKEIKDKIKLTMLKKYGVDNISKLDYIKDIKKKTMIENHNVDSPFKIKRIQNKIKNTHKNKYGHISPFGSKLIQDKIRNKYLNEFMPKFKDTLNLLNLEFADEIYINSLFEHNFKCLKCNNVFKSLWGYIQQEYGLCPICYPRNQGTSKIENEIIDFIKLNINLEIIENSREIINPKELDIYIPDKKVAIEFNGLYWHSEEFKDFKYHLDKTKICIEKDIQLVHIFEDEWIFKKDIVKSRLKQILGVNDSQRIHARKCQIKEIDSKTKNEFLEQFHIQGKDNSVIKLGSFYNNELVSVMTFSHGNISKGSKYVKDIWELNRFCSNSNYHIPGIASKLLKYFQRNYEWIEIFSYADRRWSQGNVYYQLGFELDSITKPNYWYLKGGKRIHRFSLRKRPDEPKDVTEIELRIKDGYKIIWDCGSIKFIIKK